MLTWYTWFLLKFSGYLFTMVNYRTVPKLYCRVTHFKLPYITSSLRSRWSTLFHLSVVKCGTSQAPPCTPPSCNTPPIPGPRMEDDPVLAPPLNQLFTYMANDARLTTSHDSSVSRVTSILCARPEPLSSHLSIGDCDLIDVILGSWFGVYTLIRCLDQPERVMEIKSHHTHTSP